MYLVGILLAINHNTYISKILFEKYLENSLKFSNYYHPFMSHIYSHRNPHTYSYTQTLLKFHNSIFTALILSINSQFTLILYTSIPLELINFLSRLLEF